MKITENGAYKLTVENPEEDDVVGDDDAEILIECKNVYKSFGDKHILRGANFKVCTNDDMIAFRLLHDERRDECHATGTWCTFHRSFLC